LGDAASEASSVVVAYDHDLHRVRERGARLAELLRQLPGVELVRIEREADTIIWERHPRTSGGELAVVASTWAEAGRLAVALSAPEVAEALPGLARRISH
jgi:hypothetical protein